MVASLTKRHRGRLDGRKLRTLTRTAWPALAFVPVQSADIANLYAHVARAD